MWRRSINSKKGVEGMSKRGSRGFTLIEATISMTLLVIVLALSLTVLFNMKSFAERQELFALPRQTARRAIEYLSSKIMSAGDQNSPLNRSVTSPSAIMVQYASAHGPENSCADNVADANLADLNTDIFSINLPQGGIRLNAPDWSAGSPIAPIPLKLEYGFGCPNSATNLQDFENLTGYDAATGRSAVLTLVSSDGAWSTYQITDYQAGSNSASCGMPTPAFNVIGNSSYPGGIDPPGGRPGLANVVVAANQFMSFRVRQGSLEQKLGLIDSTIDNPGANFTQLLDSVEDMQVAYIYWDGTVLDGAAGFPTQAGPTTDPTALPAADVVNVRGLRITIVARSPRAIPNQIFSHQRPINVEDHVWPANTPADNFYRYRLTATVMIRNRMLGD